MSADIDKLIVGLGALIATLTALYKLVIQPINLAWKTREESIARLEEDLERLKKDRDESWKRAREELNQLQTEREEVSRKLQEALERLDDASVERFKQQEEITQLRERNKRMEEDSVDLKAELDRQTGVIEKTLVAHDAELSRMNDATSLQLDNMRRLLEVSQVQINSLRSIYEVAKYDLDRTKMEEAKKIEQIALELENYKAFLQRIGLSAVLIDKIGEGKLLVEEAKTTIVTSLTKRDTSEVDVPPTEESP